MARKKFKPVTELFKESSQIVRDNLGLFLLLNILSIISAAWDVGTALKDKTSGYGWGAVFRNGIFGDGQNTPSTHNGSLSLLIVVVALALQLMATILVVRSAAGKKPTLGNVWAEFRVKWVRLLGVTVLAGLFIIVGFIIFIIPGILILPRLIMAPYLLVDQNTGVREAINKSWDLAEGAWDRIYAVVLFGILLSLIGLVPVIGPIVSTALIILYSVAMPLRYFELKAKA